VSSVISELNSSKAAQANLNARSTLADLTRAQESNLSSLRKLLPGSWGYRAAASHRPGQSDL
jgi:hypothetical protein